MRQIQINLYRFDELSESAQRRAWEKHSQPWDYFDDREYRETLKAFECAFDVDVYRWCVDADGFNFAFAHDQLAPEGEWLRFARWVSNRYGDYTTHPRYYSKVILKEGEYPRYISRYSRATRVKGADFTGFYADEVITDPVWNCIHYTDAFFNYDQLLESCLTAFFECWRDDMEYHASLEHFAEMAEANDWEFTKYGEMWEG